MKFSPLFYLGLAVFIVSCGNGANDSAVPTESPDSLVSNKLAGVSVVEINDTDSLNTSTINGIKGNDIDSMLDSFEIMITEVRKEYYIDDHYNAPPGHKYHIHIHPVIELYEDLHSRQDKMSTEQLSRFRRLTKKILDTL